jgi:hypothetical protein
LENLNDSKGISRSLENIKDSITTSVKQSLDLFELKQHKPWFDEECLCFLDQRNQVKMQWVQDPNRDDVDNLKKLPQKRDMKLVDISGTKEGISKS